MVEIWGELSGWRIEKILLKRSQPCVQAETREGEIKAEDAEECCAESPGLGVVGVGRASASVRGTGNVSASFCASGGRLFPALGLSLENKGGGGLWALN